MSRIAKLPVTVPSGVEVNIAAGTLRAKGPKGEASLPLPDGIAVAQDGEVLRVTIADTDRAKDLSALWGTTRALTANVITGVSTGFERRLSIVGVGYRAKAEGAKLNLNLGFSHPVVYQLPDGVTAETPEQTEIVLRGISKQQVNQCAAEIRAYRPPEPYKGKGIRYQDEHVRRKQAKKK